MTCLFIKKSIACTALAGIIAASGISAFAAENDISVHAAKENAPQLQETQEKQAPCRPDADPARMQEKVKSALDGLVKNGTITQDQENAVLKAMAEKREKAKAKIRESGEKSDKCEKGKPHGHKHGVLKDLVKDGTISQEQADAIRKAIRSTRDSVKEKER